MHRLMLFIKMWEFFWPMLFQLFCLFLTLLSSWQSIMLYTVGKLVFSSFFYSFQYLDWEISIYPFLGMQTLSSANPNFCYIPLVNFQYLQQLYLYIYNIYMFIHIYIYFYIQKCQIEIEFIYNKHIYICFSSYIFQLQNFLYCSFYNFSLFLLFI